MPIQQTLEKVQRDIQNKNLGKARDRLHGLINSYPDELKLRKMLGDIYWQLQLPEMAGRYWYLEEKKDENMIAACKRFEAQFKQDPMYMLFAIKYKGDLGKIEGTYAGRTLMDLHQQAKEKYAWYADFQNKGVERFTFGKYDRKYDDNHDSQGQLGCIIVLILISVMFVIGCITIINWVFNLCV